MVEIRRADSPFLNPMMPSSWYSLLNVPMIESPPVTYIKRNTIDICIKSKNVNDIKQFKNGVKSDRETKLKYSLVRFAVTSSLN